MAGVEDVRERLRFDTPFWARHCAKILNKDKQLVPLVAHPWQLEYDAVMERQRARGLPMRVIVLKARQLGFSTWTAAKFAQRVTQLPYQHAMVVAQDNRTAGWIHQMATRIYDNLPSQEELGLGFSIKPEEIGRHFSTTGRKYIEVGDRVRKGVDSSVFEIDTANAPESTRGMTLSMAHLSEVARWPERATSGPGSKMLAVLNAVPYRPETIVVLESTANGLNFFYRRYIAARDGADDPETGESYAHIFVPWWRDPGCAEPFSSDAARERFIERIGDTRKDGAIAEDEPALMELYGCTPEQLMWRRMMIRTQHEGSVELFKQENPASDDEAFISSGRPFFSSILVAKAIKAAEAAPEPVLGTLRGAGWTVRKTRGGTVNVPTRALWVPEELAAATEPLLRVWEHPVTEESQEGLPVAERRPHGAYVVAVDVAEGATDTFTDDTDFHAVSVWDHRERMQVAEYESRIDRHLLPLWVLLVALYYNEAWLAIEVNSVGVAVNDPVQKDYKYRRMYRRRRTDHARNVVENKIGWKTSNETKPLIEDAMGSALQSDTHGGMRSVRCARQLSTYIKDERGRRGAMPGEHDDLLVAAMIAQRVMEEIRPSRTERERRVRGFRESDPLTGY